MKGAKSSGMGGRFFLVVLVTAIVLFVAYSIGQNSNSPALTSTPTATVKSANTPQGRTVQVEKDYWANSGEAYYYFTISTGNTSSCIWTYAGGAAYVSYSDTTNAKTGTEVHILHPFGGVEVYADFKVTCVDDLGNRYTGIFPPN